MLRSIILANGEYVGIVSQRKIGQSHVPYFRHPSQLNTLRGVYKIALVEGFGIPNPKHLQGCKV